jgi:hypothetical protein
MTKTRHTTIITSKICRAFDRNVDPSLFYIRLTSFHETPTVKDDSLIKPSEFEQSGGKRLQRFYVRTLAGVFGPFVIGAYFIAIWRIYILPAEKAEGPLTFGKHGAMWIFYSWFATGVVGLNLSLYILKGVEGAMLMEPLWNVGDANRLMLHADTTWSGPGGWIKTAKWSRRPASGMTCRVPSGLWLILAFPSILIFIAWPLSGLTMEISQGYRHAYAHTNTSMVGFNYDSFNERALNDALSDAAFLWRAGVDARVPGAGIVYTPEDYDRSQNKFLNKVPAVLPDNDGIPEIFLAAQADNPIEGSMWGLRLQYNCSIIEQVQDFRILGKVNRTSSPSLPVLQSYPSQYVQNQEYVVHNNLMVDRYWLGNLDAVAEFAVEFWPNNSTRQRLPLPLQQRNFFCYVNEDKEITGEYPGMYQNNTFEVALWQHLHDGVAFKDISIKPNLSVDHNITDYYGTYVTQRPPDFSKVDSIIDETPIRMTAIGVQCNASSNVGRADINGVKSSFSNFQRTDTPMPKIWNRCAPRFRSLVPNDMLSSFGTGINRIQALFQASPAPPPYYGTFDGTDKSNSTQKYRVFLQPGYLQAEELRQSLLRAYAAFAIQLMYNGGRAVTTLNGSQITFTNPNATEFTYGTVIKPGVMPAIVPLSFFCLWALITSTLSLVYGFRRRWAETLDGHTMFRLGAEIAAQQRKELLKTSNIIRDEDDAVLEDIPALVGDTKPEFRPGRIGLVKDAKADKKKRYE